MTSTLYTALSHSTVVPREHVHRDAVSEVYLTDIICDRYPNFRIGVHLPKSHSYYNDHVGAAESRYDLLLVLECFRQTSILIAHRHVGVDFDQSFIFNAADLKVASPEAMVITSRPGNGELSAVIVDEKVRGDEVVGITLEMQCRLADDTAATVSMSIQWMPREVWARVRRKGRARLGLAEYCVRITPPQGRGSTAVRGGRPAEVLGRRIERNVVLGAARKDADALEVDVVVDQRHPSLFDHPLDHIPGAVLFEAIRQAGIFASGELLNLDAQRLVLHSLRAEFTRFGELDLHTSLRIRQVGEVGSLVSFHVEIGQEGESITIAQVQFAVSNDQALVSYDQPSIGGAA